MIIKTPANETLLIVRVTHDFIGEFGLPDKNNVMDHPLRTDELIYCKDIQEKDGGSHFLLTGIATDMGEVDLILCPDDFERVGKPS